MAVDIGIPICGVVAMTGSDTIPVNLMLMDGSVVEEKRSPLYGKTVPNWVQNDSECIPTQCSPYDGTVYKEDLYQDLSITEDNLPDGLNISYDVACVLKGYSGSTGDAGDSTLYSTSSNMFTNNIFYSNYAASIDNGSNFGGDSVYHMKMDNDTSASNLRLDNHSHTVTLTHTSNHGIVYSSSSNTYIGDAAYGFTGGSGSTTLTVGGGSSETTTRFPRRRNTLDVKWYMRIY